MRRFLFVAAVVAAGCSSHVTSTTDVDPTKPTRPDVVETPAAPRYTAIVKAKRSKVLVAPFAGRVDEVLVRPSQVVHAGEVLARQDTRELRYQLEQSLAEEGSALASADRARIEVGVAANKLRVATVLAQRDAGPRIAVGQAAAEVAAANATASAERKTADARAASAASIQDKIDHAEIKAPFDGVISMVHVKDGDAVSAGATIIRVFDPSELIVEFAVPSADETPLERDMKVQLELPHHEPISAVITDISDQLPDRGSRYRHPEPALGGAQVERDRSRHDRIGSGTSLALMVDERRFPCP